MNIQLTPLFTFLSIIFVFLNPVAHCQTSPVWQATPYIEAKSTTVVSNAQKTFGTYTVTITFSQAFSTAALALGTTFLNQLFHR